MKANEIEWVDGADFYWFGCQFKAVGGKLFYFSSSESEWLESYNNLEDTTASGDVVRRAKPEIAANAYHWVDSINRFHDVAAGCSRAKYPEAEAPNTTSSTVGVLRLNESKTEWHYDDLNDGKKYEREIVGLCGARVKVDVYRVLDAFKTGDPILDHLVKKALCAGGRGHKDKLTDYKNIAESAVNALELLKQK